jgi:hypothetical protein
MPLSTIVRSGGPPPRAPARNWNGCTATAAPMALSRLSVEASTEPTCASDQRRSLIGVVLFTVSNVLTVSSFSAGERLCCWNAHPSFAMRDSAAV